MAEFIPRTEGRVAGKLWDDLDFVTQGYLEALMFTETEDGPWRYEDLVPEALASILADVTAFSAQVQIAALWKGGWMAIHSTADNGFISDETGRDLLYTRNGHGVGFWDTDRWPEPYGPVLDAAAKALPPTTAYRGDDGRIYVGVG